MNPCLHAKPRFQPRNIPHHSTKVHTAKVKLGNAKNSLNIDIYILSLSSFTCSPAPARARVYTRVRVCLGVNHGKHAVASDRRGCGTGPRTFAPCGVMRPGLGKDATAATRPTRANVAYSRAIPPVVGTSRRFHAGEVCGNSSRPKHSFISVSELARRHVMDRKEITSSLVKQIETLLAEKVDSAAISGRLGITQYVVEVIANDVDRPVGHSRPPCRTSRRVPNTKPGIDASTIRMIQRMLAVGILNHAAIAREAGVSPNTVSDVAAGRRKAVTTRRLNPGKDEQFLPQPIRCGECGSLISVAPCRACRARREAAAKKIV